MLYPMSSLIVNLKLIVSFIEHNKIYNIYILLVAVIMMIVMVDIHLGFECMCVW